MKNRGLYKPNKHHILVDNPQLLLLCSTVLDPHLPYIEQVTLPVVDQVGVEDQVTVASIEVTEPLRVHSDELQILNSPHLCTS